MRNYIRIDLTGRLCCHILTRSDGNSFTFFNFFFRTYNAYAGSLFFHTFVAVVLQQHSMNAADAQRFGQLHIDTSLFVCVCVWEWGKFHRSDQLIVLEMQGEKYRKKDNRRTFIDVAAWNLTENHEKQQEQQQQQKEHATGMGGTWDKRLKK